MSTDRELRELRELEVGHAEAEAAALEASLAGEVARLGRALEQAGSRLQLLRAAAGSAGAADIAGRLQRAALPQLKLEGWREEALAARTAAVKARMKANEAMKQAIQGFGAELNRLVTELSAEESALEAARRKKEDDARRAQHAQTVRMPGPPPPLHAEDRTPTVEGPSPALGRGPPALPVKGAEPRRNPRVRMQAAIDLHSESNFFTGFSTNISDGGIFVATVATMPIGTEVEVGFSLPNGRKVQVHGVVRWAREVNDRTPEIFPGVGIQFVGLSAEVSSLIHDFVSSRDPMFFPD